jgi:hypothetical protein
VGFDRKNVKDTTQPSRDYSITMDSLLVNMQDQSAAAMMKAHDINELAEKLNENVRKYKTPADPFLSREQILETLAENYDLFKTNSPYKVHARPIHIRTNYGTLRKVQTSKHIPVAEIFVPQPEFPRETFALDEGKQKTFSNPLILIR